MWLYVVDSFFFFIARFWMSTKVVYLRHWHGWYHMKQLPSQCVAYTLYNHAPHHIMQSHTNKVHACLTVTCHLHFWQNDWDLSHATAVTQGWNRYRNKSQHGKLAQETKIFPPLSVPLHPPHEIFVSPIATLETTRHSTRLTKPNKLVLRVVLLSACWGERSVQ